MATISSLTFVTGALGFISVGRSLAPGNAHDAVRIRLVMRRRGDAEKTSATPRETVSKPTSIDDVLRSLARGLGY